MTPLTTGRVRPATPHPDASARSTTGADSGAPCRVSVREVREVAFRAALAAGASGGEAATVADLTVSGEILDGEGVRALIEELDHVPHARVPVSREGGSIDVLHDPAGRGPLLLGTLAADLAAAGERLVLLSGLRWTRALEWVLLDSAARTTTPLLATAMRADGSPDVSVRATPHGAVYRAGHSPGSVARGPRAAFSTKIPLSCGEGVLLSRWTEETLPTGLAPTRSAAQQQERLTTARKDGLHVDRDVWSSACAAARRFLLPEPAGAGVRAP